ncbi:MAG: BMP family ABC transporter substrate-binding protein [Eubacterium sp.]|nr:BMP family ABC transporter substrate-binding protein [Eubacterium sp.]
MREDYVKAKKQADKALRKAAGEGRYPYLTSLDSFLPNYMTLAKVPVGIMDIPISMIAGTVTEGRQNAFTWNFLPTLRYFTEFGQKWSRLYDAQQSEGIHDPIKCFEYLNRFYVLEGNKRVSVLTYCGAKSISADITRILPAKSDDRDIQVYYEFLDYFKVTRLYGIVFSKPGCYARLAALYGQDLSTPWPVEAVEDLRSDFNRFSASYEEKGGDNLRISPGDAFLIYLSFYHRESLQEDNASEIGKKIALIWNELLSAENEESAALLETPDTTKKGNLLTSIFTPSWTKEHPLRVAFLYSRDPKTSRWLYGHELGRNELNQTYEGVVDAISFDNCNTEEKLDAAFAAAAADQDEVVFTTSPDMMDASKRAAIKYPHMKILNCSIDLMSSAVRTYYPKMYEAKLIMGALAASYADDHRIGYVADYPLNGNIANINAFAIGAAMIDPDVKITLKWSGLKNSRWEAELAEESLKVISGPDLIRPDEASRKYGVYKLLPDGTIFNIAAPIWNWGQFYVQIVDTVLDGSWNNRENISKEQAINYWFGFSSGAISVILSQNISYYSRKMAYLFQDSIRNGSLDPFWGELHSQTGTISDAQGNTCLTNDQIIHMNWLNDNIIGSIPDMSLLTDSIHPTMQRSGVQSAATGENIEKH